MSKEISFVPFTAVTGFNRVRTSVSLLNARDSNTQELRVELPFADKIYQSPIKAYKRIGYIAAQMHMGKLDAFVTERDGIVQGVATRMPMAWARDSSVSNPTELSYWIRRQEDKAIAIEIGTSILSGLIHYQEDDGNALWMVTLPDDEIKQSVCEANGMAPVGIPQTYHIDDGVTVDRQLWIK